MKITCKGKSFLVHRYITCSQSKPLAAAMDSNFKVCSKSSRISLANMTQEGITKTIDFEEDFPETVKLMLDFMYTSNYWGGI